MQCITGNQAQVTFWGMDYLFIGFITRSTAQNIFLRDSTRFIDGFDNADGSGTLCASFKKPDYRDQFGTEAFCDFKQGMNSLFYYLSQQFF